MLPSTPLGISLSVAGLRLRIEGNASWSSVSVAPIPRGNINCGLTFSLLGWKGDRESVVPSWTTMSDDGSTPSAFAPLLPLLECPPEFQNLVFRPLLSAIGHPHALPTDFITLFIPAQVSDDAKLALFGRQIHRFNNTFAHVSHEAAGEMIFASRGWSLGESEDGETKEVVHVLVHVWKNADDERRYKHGEDKKYERFLLEPLREAESLGVEWSEIRMLMTRVWAKLCSPATSDCN